MYGFTDDDRQPGAFKAGDERTVNLAQKGGKKSVEVRRRKAEMKRIAETILSMSLSSGKVLDVDELESFAGASKKNYNVATAIVLKAAQAALQGDLRAAEFLRDTAGQRPSTTVEVSQTGEGLAEFRAALEAEKARGVPEDGRD